MEETNKITTTDSEEEVTIIFGDGESLPCSEADITYTEIDTAELEEIYDITVGKRMRESGIILMNFGMVNGKLTKIY